MVNILILVFIVSFSACYIVTRKKIFVIVSILALGLFCLINDNLPDDANYRNFYDAVGEGSNNEFLGVGRLYLCKIGNVFGLSYSLFKAAIYMIGLTLLTISINCISKRSQPAFLMYLIFPGVLDLIQIRFFLAASIIILGFIFLIKFKGVFAFLSYVVMWAIASLIHNSCIFYILFAFIPILSMFNFKARNLAIFLLIADLIIIVFSKQLVSLLYFVLPDIQASRIEAYVNGNTTSFFGMLIYTAFLFGELALIYYLSKTSKANFPRQKKMTKYILYANILLLLSLPLIYLSSDFLRLQRMFLVLNYALVYALITRNYTVYKKVFGIRMSLKAISYIGISLYFLVFVLVINNYIFGYFF